MLSYFVSDLTARCAIDFQPLNLYIVRLWAPTVNYSRRILSLPLRFVASVACLSFALFLFLPYSSYLPFLVHTSFIQLLPFSEQSLHPSRLRVYLLRVCILGPLRCALVRSSLLLSAHIPARGQQTLGRSDGICLVMGRSRKEDASRSHWCGSLIGR